MTSSISWIQKILFLMIWSLEVRADDKVCSQCATPELRNNWALTGLPKKPSTLVFDDECKKLTATDQQDANFTSASCPSSCFEILIPLNNDYEFVRGCHADFVWDEFKVTNNSCRVNLVSKTGDKAISAGIHFCQPNSTTRCNNVLDPGAVRDSDGTVVACPDFDEVHTCKQCTEYSGSGSCSPSTTGTCKAPFCTKIRGTLTGATYESRGCAFFNPIGSNVCSWTDQTFNVTTGVDTVAARKKRAISMPFQADQCYCQGELCNSTLQLSTLLFSITSASFLVFM